jgi:hypothetical protein
MTAARGPLDQAHRAGPARHWTDDLEARAEEMERRRRLAALADERRMLIARLAISGADTERGRARRRRVAALTTEILMLETGRSL